MRAVILDSKRAIESRGNKNRELLLGSFDPKKAADSDRAGNGSVHDVLGSLSRRLRVLLTSAQVRAVAVEHAGRQPSAVSTQGFQSCGDVTVCHPGAWVNHPVRAEFNS